MSQQTTTPKKGTVRRGSDFSDRQINYSVKEGLVVTFDTLTTEVRGWVFGADDFHWGVVDVHGRRHVVHKSAPRFVVEPDSSWEKQPTEVQTLVAKVVEPFRAAVMRDHFGQTNPA